MVVLAEVERPPSWPTLGRLLTGALGLLPTYRDLRGGRRKAFVFRALFLGGALVLAVQGSRTLWNVLGVACLAAAGGLLPVPQRRHERWLMAARGMAQPTMVPGPAPATLHCDGKKVTITCRERVWGSLRPAANGCALRMERRADELWLGLVPPRGVKRPPLWFVGPVSDLPDDAVGTCQAAEGDAHPTPIRLEGERWAQVVEVFSDPRFLTKAP